MAIYRYIVASLVNSQRQFADMHNIKHISEIYVTVQKPAMFVPGSN